MNKTNYIVQFTYKRLKRSMILILVITKSRLYEYSSIYFLEAGCSFVGLVKFNSSIIRKKKKDIIISGCRGKNMRHGTLGPISLSARKWPKSFLSHDVCAVNKQISSDSSLSVYTSIININQTKRAELSRAKYVHTQRINLK